jgi:hypothetical protein
VKSNVSENIKEERKLLANLLHLISQPITALQCSLELALNAEEDRDKCRDWLVAALENSERLRCRLSLAREVAEAADPGEVQIIELRSLLQEVLCEIAPLGEGTGTMPQLHCDEIPVVGQRSRLFRAFLYVMQHLRASNEPVPDISKIHVECKADLIEVRFLHFVLQPKSNKDHVNSHLEIAKGILEAAGGGLVFYCFPGNDAFVRVFLRAPHAQLDLYEEEDSRMGFANTAIGTAAAFPQVS